MVGVPARGEVWWGETPDAKGRPYLVLTRDVAIPVLRTVLVAPVTRTIRDIPSEVRLGPSHGLSSPSVASMDTIIAFPRAMLTQRLGGLDSHELWRLCDALLAATDC